MRAAPILIALAISACGPKVAPPLTFDEDFGPRAGEPRSEDAPIAEPARPEAPRGKGLRTGTIERARLIAVLDAGPGSFLRQVELTPHLRGERFVGWQLVQLLDRRGPLGDVDVVPGDVLLAINGKPLSRPDQLHTLWNTLRTANELSADLWRGDGKVRLAFAIEPAVEPATR
jgi:hypothetical protein